jgi:hypothetical protein
MNRIFQHMQPLGDYSAPLKISFHVELFSADIERRASAQAGPLFKVISVACFKQHLSIEMPFGAWTILWLGVAQALWR